MVSTEHTRFRHDGANELLSDIRRLARLPRSVTPQAAWSAVMCTFSEHVAGAEVRRILSAFPPDVRSLLDERMIHRDEPASPFDRDEFLRRVASHLGVSRKKAEVIASAVVAAASARLPAGEVADLAHRLPADLRGFWVVRHPSSPTELHPIFDSIEQSVELPPGVTGESAVVAVLSTLSQRLTLGEVHHLFEGLPEHVHALVEGCLRGRGEKPDPFHRGVFLLRVAEQMKTSEDWAELTVRAVFRAIRPYFLPGVVEHVKSQLPHDMRDIWDAP